MKHIRPDYNKRIQDNKNLIPEDEPVFLLRGQDPVASQTVNFYAASVEDLGAEPEFVAAIRAHSKKMLDCYAKHTDSHIPDVPESSDSDTKLTY